MVNVFSDSEKKHAFRTKKKLLLFWFGILAIYLAIVLTLMIVDIYLVSVHRNRDPKVWMMIIAIVVSILFGCFSLFFFSLKYKLTKKFCKMLRDIDRGLKDTIDAKFLEYDDNISMKDGVYFYAMVLDCKPLKREDITIRKLLIERTVEKIPLEPGTKLKITSHANILVSYEKL